MGPNITSGNREATNLLFGITCHRYFRRSTPNDPRDQGDEATFQATFVEEH